MFGTTLAARGSRSAFAHLVRDVPDDRGHFEKRLFCLCRPNPASDRVPEAHHVVIDDKDKILEEMACGPIVRRMAKKISEQPIVAIERPPQCIQAGWSSIGRQLVSRLQKSQLICIRNISRVVFRGPGAENEQTGIPEPVKEQRQRDQDYDDVDEHQFAPLQFAAKAPLLGDYHWMQPSTRVSLAKPILRFA